MAAWGCEVQWTANPEGNIRGYYVYCGANSGTYDHASSPLWVGNVVRAVYLVASSGTWYFAVAAEDTDGNVSGLSQELTKTAVYRDWPPVGTPRIRIQ